MTNEKQRGGSDPLTVQLDRYIRRYLPYLPAMHKAYAATVTPSTVTPPTVPQHYAKEGQWITIGAKLGADGKKHGGTPVMISGGRIVKGHPSLTGRKIDALSEEPEQGTHREQLHQSRGHARATWGKKARAEGIGAGHLHQLAAEILAHDRAFTEDHNRALRDARALSKHYGRDIGTWQRWPAAGTSTRLSCRISMKSQRRLRAAIQTC